MNASETIGLGLVGCGGFGIYATDHFLKTQLVHVAGVTDAYGPAARRASDQFDAPIYESLDDLLKESDVDLVYLATPPYLHYEQAMAALAEGKHVICEKPLAVKLEQAEQMVALARRKDLLLTANLMQRYNPLFQFVRKILSLNLLGHFIHGYFENYASDDNLKPNHWFWDERASGGIFIEHGVHFFDLFAGWFGQGKVLAAQRGLRPSNGVEEHVQCTVRYDDDQLVNFYHGFHQNGRMDRQELRLVFERGDITLFGWIPTRMKLYALIDEVQKQQLGQLLPDAEISVVKEYDSDHRLGMARHKPIDGYQIIEMNHGQDIDKQQRYGELLQAMLSDQLMWIDDRLHHRTITEENGYQSLAMAVEATYHAQKGAVHAHAAVH